MDGQHEGPAEELVAVASFATSWMRGGHPAPMDGWRFQAMPGLFSVTVRDEAGEEVPWEDAEQFFVGRAGFWHLPADASGVVTSDWHKWADGPRRRIHPGGRYPYNTDLLVTCRADGRINLLLSMGPTTVRGAQMWIGGSRDGAMESPFGPNGTIPPDFRQVPSIIPGLPRYETDRPAPRALDRLARPGAHRAASWQQAWGGRRWNAVVVSARGYPDLRVLQVAINERWIGYQEAFPAMQQALRRVRFWPQSPGNRVVVTADEEEDLISSVAEKLIAQAQYGHHTPAYPIGRRYLQQLIRKDLATLPDRSSRRPSSLAPDELGGEDDALGGDRLHRRGGLPRPGSTSLLDGTLADQPQTSPWSERHLRRVITRLAQEAGYPSLTLLTPDERQGYEVRAIEELRERDRLRELRRSIREVLVQRGVMLTPEAIQQFVARHGDEPPQKLMRSVSRYLERPRQRPAKPRL